VRLEFDFRAFDSVVESDPTTTTQLNSLSFRGTLRAEESLLLCAFRPGGIPHFVRFTVNVHRERNDDQETFPQPLCSLCD
jgi:hypothetical protein